MFYHHCEWHVSFSCRITVRDRMLIQYCFYTSLFFVNSALGFLSSSSSASRSCQQDRYSDALSRRLCPVFRNAALSPISHHIPVLGSTFRNRPGGLDWRIVHTILAAIWVFSVFLLLGERYFAFIAFTTARYRSFPEWPLTPPPRPERTSFWGRYRKQKHFRWGPRYCILKATLCDTYWSWSLHRPAVTCQYLWLRRRIDGVPSARFFHVMSFDHLTRLL